jgi:signal transduction histidine kinase
MSAPSLDPVRAEVDLIVSAVAIPVLVVDYTRIVERFERWSHRQVMELLERDDAALMECTELPRVIAASPQWVRLYGDPLAGDDTLEDPPDLPHRRFTPDAYPDLRATLVQQFAAPSAGITSIVREHAAPTLSGDVVVRSHWKASTLTGYPRYDRVVIVDLDVTDLRMTQRSLEDALEEKDRFVATVSHELRNPITSVTGIGSVLRSEWRTMGEDERWELIDLLAGQAEDMRDILDDLLATSVGDALRVSDEEVPLGTILEALDLSVAHCSVDTALRVAGDPLRIRQVLRNLLANAVRYGGPVLRIATEVQDGTVHLMVLDNGAGPGGEVLTRLFEPYAHGGNSGSLGLGLSVSRRLARAMGGDLHYRRADGWTCFTLTLRLA